MAYPQSILCTALPNGLSGNPDGSLKLSIYVSPHLEMTGSPSLRHMSDYDPIFLKWAEAAQTMKFKVEVDPGGANHATFTNVKHLSTPVPKLWTSLFSPTGSTPVIPYQYGEGMTDHYLRTYPLDMVLTWIKNLYIAVAKTNDENFPPLEALTQALSPIEIWSEAGRLTEDARARPTPNMPAGESHKENSGKLTSMVQTALAQIAPNVAPNNPLYASLREDLLWLYKDAQTELLPQTVTAMTEIASELASKKYVKPSASPNPSKDFLQAQLFFRPRSARDLQHVADPVAHKDPYIRSTLPSATELANTMDFHKMIGALGQYPNLLRAMGLVVDLEIPNTIAQPGSTLRIIPDVPASITVNAPLTNYLYNGKTFVAKPSASDVKDGMLVVNSTSYVVNQLEPDGAAIKTMNQALVLRRMMDRMYDGMPKHGTVPALRSGGLGLVRTGRGQEIAERLANQKTLNTNISSATQQLFAQDIIRGYRVDIYDKDADAWFSLFARTGTYLFSSTPTDGSQLNPVDEGFLQTSGTKSSDNSTKDLYVNEQLFSWHGWSLAAPRPGKTIGPNDADDGTGKPDIRDPQDPASGVNQAVTNLQVSFKPVKGTLPSLRFGKTYRIRLRAVDLAGNSLTVDDATMILKSGGGSETDEHVYYRFEPVLPPIIQSDSKVMTQDDTSGSPAPSGGQIPGESLETLVIRSIEGKTIAEYVSPFEKLFAPPTPPAPGVTYPTAPNYVAIATRKLLPPSVAGDFAEKHGSLDTAGGKIDPAAYANILTNTTYAADDARSNNILPDPMAKGVTMRFYDEAGALVKTIDNIDWYAGGTKWPALPNFTVNIQEDNPGTWWDGKTLTVPLNKSEILFVRVSSYPSESGAERMMGIWNWIKKSGVPPNTLTDMLKRIAQGRNWLISPYLVLKLVHAVQRPLAMPPPKFVALDLAQLKKLGETHAMLYGVIAKHGKSTAKISLQATWTDPIDDGTSALMPVPTQHSMHVFDEKMTDLFTDFKFNAAATGKLHEFGDTKHRTVTYLPIGSSRFREYFPQYASEDNFTLDGEPKIVNILSSARPSAPKLKYIVPTFGWDTPHVDSKSAAHNRTGGGLRVYLDRTWFSSGDGECLGVLIRPQTNTAYNPKASVNQAATTTSPAANLSAIETSSAISAATTNSSSSTNVGDKVGNAINIITNFLAPADDALVPYVSAWGMDPIWMSNPTYQAPSFNNFKNAAVDASNNPLMETGLSLDELKNTANRVAVIGYDVHADLDRQVWYADLEIDAGPSYTPFVRLALARYQPNSLRNQSGANPDVCLSRVVLADFIQLVPGRGLSILFDPANPTIIDITVTGISYRASGASQTSSRIEVTIEVKPAASAGVEENLAWLPSDAVVDSELDRVYGAGPNLWDGLWTGRVTLPSPRSNDPVNPKFRIVVKEFETFHQDPDKMWENNKPAEPIFTWRLVYADAIEI